MTNPLPSPSPYALEAAPRTSDPAPVPVRQSARLAYANAETTRRSGAHLEAGALPAEVRPCWCKNQGHLSSGGCGPAEDELDQARGRNTAPEEEQRGESYHDTEAPCQVLNNPSS